MNLRDLIDRIDQLSEQAAPVTWRQIYDLNKNVIGADPNKIKPNQVLQLPGGGSYTVKKGDNLTKIAQSVGGAAPAAQPAADAAAPAATPAAAPAATDAASLRTAQDAAAGKEPAVAQDAMAAADAGDQGTSNYTGQDVQSPGARATPDAMAGADAGDQKSSGYSTQSQAQKSPDVATGTSGYTGGTTAPSNQVGLAASGSPTGADQEAPAAAPAAPATAPAASGLPNPWEGKDPAKASAWAALSPEDQKWIGKADPTDKFILARAPSKGGFVGSITPNFMKKKQSAPAAPAAPAAPDAGAQTQAVPTPEIERVPQPVVGGPGQMSESRDLDRMMMLAGIPQEPKKKVNLNESIIDEAPIGDLFKGAAKYGDDILRYGKQAKDYIKNKLTPKPKPPAPAPAPTPSTVPPASAPPPPSPANVGAAMQSTKLAQEIEKLLAAKDQRAFTAELHELQKKALQMGINEKSFLRQLVVGIGTRLGGSKLLWLGGAVAGMYATRSNRAQSFTEWATENGLEVGSDIYNATINFVAKDDAARAQAADMAKKGASEKEIADMLVNQHKMGSAKAQLTAKEMVQAYPTPSADDSSAPASPTDAQTTGNDSSKPAASSSKPAASQEKPADQPAAEPNKPNTSTVDKIQRRSSEWDLNPNNSWSGEVRETRILTQHPVTKQIVEIAVNKNLQRVKEGVYLESIDCGLYGQYETVWQSNTWIKKPVSKIIKGIR